VESMVDHVLESMPTADSASELHSEYGGAAAEFSAQPAAESAAESGVAAATANPLADPMVNPIGLSRAEENAMRSDSAAAGRGRLAGRMVAARHTVGGHMRQGKQAAAPPPGWKPSPALGDAAQALPAAAEPEQRRSRFASVTGAPPNAAGAKLGERLFQRFRDPALERQFCLSQAALLRPVRLWLDATLSFYSQASSKLIEAPCAMLSVKGRLCRQRWSLHSRSWRSHHP